MTDQAIADLHDLDDVQLIAVGGLAGVVPGHPAPISEKPTLEPAPLRGLVGEDLLHESPQVATAPHDTFVGAEQMAYQWTLERCVRVIEAHGCVEVDGRSERFDDEQNVLVPC